MLQASYEDFLKGRADIIDNIVSAVGVSDSDVNVTGKVYEGHVVQEIHTVSIINETSDYSRLILGIDNGALFIPLREEKAVPSGEYVYTSNPILLGRMSQLKAVLEGTTTGDIIRMYVNGVRFTLR